MSVSQARKDDKTIRLGWPRADVDVGKILTLYIDNIMSARQVAEVVGLSHTTVARIIAEEKGQLRSWRMPGEECECWGSE